MIKPTDKIIRNPNLAVADMEGDTVMMSVDTGKYYNLGNIGGVIWKLIETPVSLDELIDELINKYDVSREVCMKDTVNFLEDMLEEKIITIE